MLTLNPKDIWKWKPPKSNPRTQVDLWKESCSIILRSGFGRCFSTHPRSYLQINIDFQVKKVMMYMLDGISFFVYHFKSFADFDHCKFWFCWNINDRQFSRVSKILKTVYLVPCPMSGGNHILKLKYFFQSLKFYPDFRIIISYE